MSTFIRGMCLGGSRAWSASSAAVQQPSRQQQQQQLPLCALNAALKTLVTLQGDYTLVPMAALLPPSLDGPAAAGSSEWWAAIDRSGTLDEFPNLPPPPGGAGAGGDGQQLLHLLTNATTWGTTVCGVASASSWSEAGVASIARELEYAAYIGLAGVVVPPMIPSIHHGRGRQAISTASNYQATVQQVPMQKIANCIGEYCQKSNSTRVWVASPVPLVSAKSPTFGPDIVPAAARWQAFDELQSLLQSGANSTTLGSLHPNAAISKVIMLPVVLGGGGEGEDEATHVLPADVAPLLGENISSFVVGGHSAKLWERATELALEQVKDDAHVMKRCCTCIASSTTTTTTTDDDAPRSIPAAQFLLEMLRRGSSPIVALEPEEVMAAQQGDNNNDDDALDVVDVLFSEFQRCCAVLKDAFTTLNAPFEEFAAHMYEDAVQVPLQPLGHNISNATYGVFEHDAAKYHAYRDAVGNWLRQFQHEATKAAAAAVPNGGAFNVEIVVLGAGRGPLVTAALQALDSFLEDDDKRHFLRRVKVTAVEKNPGAVVHLNMMAQFDERWQSIVRRHATHFTAEEEPSSAGPVVRVVDGDGRSVATSVFTADAEEDCAPRWRRLLVSELLGSFGDNELSSECINGFLATQRALFPTKEGNTSNPVDSVISVPFSYTAFLAPVHATRLRDAVRSVGKELSDWDTYAEAAAARDDNGDVLSAAGMCRWARGALHGPCVAQGRRWHMLAAPQPSMAVVHEAFVDGRQVEPPVVESVSTATYTSTNDARLSGFVGFFTSVLSPKFVEAGCEEETISILPSAHTPGMYSWFPMFFPLETTVAVAEGDQVVVEMRRERSESAVWYEWDTRVNSSDDGALVASVQSNIGGCNGRNVVLTSAPSI